MIIYLIVALIKKTFCNLKFARKKDLKKCYRRWYIQISRKSDLARLKAEIDKTDLGKLKAAPVSLSKLSHVVNNDVVKKTVKWISCKSK